MTTAAAAMKAISQATGIPSPIIDRAGRLLMEADTELFPKGGFGGGKNAPHVQIEHLVYLMIALSAFEPLSRAPQVARLYGSMERLAGGFATGAEKEFPNAVAETWLLDLAETLALLVNGLGRQAEYDGIAVNLGTLPGGVPFAEISLIRTGSGNDDGFMKKLGVYAPTIDVVRSEKAATPSAALRRVTTLPPALFDLMGELTR